MARRSDHSVTTRLIGKGIHYGAITAHPDGSLDTTEVRGVDADLRVRPLFAHGGTISIREFVVGALQNEMGLQAVDPDLAAAAAGGRITTPAGMVLDGSLDHIEPAAAPPTPRPTWTTTASSTRSRRASSTIMEFYLLNYFKPATYRGARKRSKVGACWRGSDAPSATCRNLPIDHDRRVADVETAYDPDRGSSTACSRRQPRSSRRATMAAAFPTIKTPLGGAFLVRNIFTDFKRHDVGPDFYERNYDGSLRKEFLTTPLWGVGTTAPYGHDGRSLNLTEVILRHGGEAQRAREAFAALDADEQAAILGFLSSSCSSPRTTRPPTWTRATRARRASPSSAMAASSWGCCSTTRATRNRHSRRAVAEGWGGVEARMTHGGHYTQRTPG